MNYCENKSLKNLPNEIWKDSLVGLTGYYQISSIGRMKTLSRLVTRSGVSMFTKELIMAQRKDNNGYYFVGLYVGKKKQKFKKIHQLLAESFLENPGKKRCVNHKNGIKADNRLDNLEWVTHKENSAHAFKNGLLHPRNGENHPISKLKESDILSIRNIGEIGGYNQREISEMYNVSRRTIGNILNKVIWKHI